MIKIVILSYEIPDSDKRVWYGGVLMHKHDYKKSSGGFVHGFLYLIRFQLRYIEWMEKGAWDGAKKFDSVSSAAEEGCTRVQNSSGLYQMQGFLVDVFVQSSSNEILHLPEIPQAWVSGVLNLAEFRARPYCMLKFEYGDVKGNWDFEETIDSLYASKTLPLFLCTLS